MYREKLGIIGGFGAYATLNFYKTVLEVFQSESERNYPHIIMDNNFTMPSRTRALLYGEGYEEVVREIAKSMEHMIREEVNRIILVCGTAHYFLPEVYHIVPEAESRVMDIISLAGEKLQRMQEQRVLIIAAEGALKKELYSRRLGQYGVECISPQQKYYEEIRFFIESVKTNKVDRETAERFLRFLKLFETKCVVLGCTEFPVLIERVREMGMAGIEEYLFVDPLALAVEKLKQTLV